MASALFIMTVYNTVVPNSAIESLISLTIGVLIALSFDFIIKTLRGQFIDDYYLNAENTSIYAGHTLVHARAEYQHSSQLNFALNIDNLLDKRYAERANYSSFTQERYFPGKPRNLKFTVKYAF